MGMFDSVMFDCTVCNSQRSVEAQSKSGDCVLERYDCERVPPSVVAGLDHAWCHECKAEFTVHSNLPHNVKCWIKP